MAREEDLHEQETHSLKSLRRSALLLSVQKQQNMALKKDLDDLRSQFEEPNDTLETFTFQFREEIQKNEIFAAELKQQEEKNVAFGAVLKVQKGEDVALQKDLQELETDTLHSLQTSALALNVQKRQNITLQKDLDDLRAQV